MSTSAREAVEERALALVDPLYNFARRLAGNDAEAEDLVQETYARAFAAAAQFAEGTNMKAWLFRILRNVFVDGRRRQKRDPATHADSVDPTNDPPSDAAVLRDDVELDRLRSVVGADLERALMDLSEEGRSVILLELEGLSEKEMADVLGCAAGTVKSRLSRARAMLRATLAEYAR